MRMTRSFPECLAAAVLCAASLAARRADGITFSLDTTAGARTVDTAAKLAALRPLVCLANETVTAAGPGGAVSTLAEDSAGRAEISWRPSCGGDWTLENSGEGSATFRVWHSLFPDAGVGTPASPAKVADADEFQMRLSGAASPDGFVFSCGEGVFASLQPVSGHGAVALGGGAYALSASESGSVFRGAPSGPFALDTEGEGPDRRAMRTSVPPVAYSGDGWSFSDGGAAAALSFESPGGAVETMDLSGDGTVGHAFSVAGAWRVTLVSDAGTLEADVEIVDPGTVFLLR